MGVKRSSCSFDARRAAAMARMARRRRLRPAAPVPVDDLELGTVESPASEEKQWE